MENGILTELCKNCAECCKNHPFVDLSETEIHSLKQLTGLHSDVFTIKKGKIVEEYFLQFQENGDCFFLNKNNGIFSCEVYEARPGICKNYPSKPTQKDFCAANSDKFLRNTCG